MLRNKERSKEVGFQYNIRVLVCLYLIWSEKDCSFRWSEWNLMNSHRKLFILLRWVQMIERNPLYSVKFWPWAVFLIRDLGEFSVIVCTYCRESSFAKALSPLSGFIQDGEQKMTEPIWEIYSLCHSLIIASCLLLCTLCVCLICVSVCVCMQNIHICAGREGWERELILIPLTLCWWPQIATV